ncbi:MAG: hypothetical protein AAGB26_05795 [Planctomycetota bacterium]
MLMTSTRAVAATCCILFLVCLFSSSIYAEGEGEKPIGENDFERLSEVFTQPDVALIKGKPWVIVDVGPADFSFDRRGWLINDGDKRIELVDLQGELHRFRRPGEDEQRPRINEDPEGKFLWADLQNADYATAWRVHVASYESENETFLEKGMPQEEGDDGIFSDVNQRFTLADHVVEAARHAHFTYQLGGIDHAEALYKHALEAQGKYSGRYATGAKNPVPLHTFVVDRIASGLSNGGIFLAHGKAPRKDLLSRWRRITSLPDHKHTDEAKAMVKHYQHLLEEDAQWVEPDAEAVEQMTQEEQVAYWMYHLRDHDAGQWMDPGRCNVFSDQGWGFDEAAKKPNPAVELKKLGVAAIPQLIAHMDDARPTRCKGHWRSYWPEGHYLLRYGDCCQQIFESITGHEIYEGGGYPIRSGAGKQCKERAAQWWRIYWDKQNDESP